MSSIIQSIEYDSPTEQLTVKFHTGTIYIYDKVPAKLVKTLQKGESLGSLFYKHIRKGGYQYRKLEPVTE